MTLMVGLKQLILALSGKLKLKWSKILINGNEIWFTFPLINWLIINNNKKWHRICIEM